MRRVTSSFCKPKRRANARSIRLCSRTSILSSLRAISISNTARARAGLFRSPARSAPSSPNKMRSNASSISAPIKAKVVPFKRPQRSALADAPEDGPIRSIQCLAVRPDRDGAHDQGEEGDRPQLGKDLRGGVALEQDAPDDAQRMGRRENLARPLRPDRHAEKWEHKAGQ